MTFPFRFKWSDINNNAASSIRRFPKQIVNTLRGILKYSIVLASANELGGITQTSDFTSTKLSSSKDLGSTVAELMLVKTLNSSAQRTS